MTHHLVDISDQSGTPLPDYEVRDGENFHVGWAMQLSNGLWRAYSLEKGRTDTDHSTLAGALEEVGFDPRLDPDFQDQDPPQEYVW